MCCSQQPVSYENIKHIKLSVNLNDKEFDVFGDWKKEKFLFLLKNKLLQNNDHDYYAIEEHESMFPIIFKQGIYKEEIISKLIGNGMSKGSIVNAMKYGLQNISSAELNHFRTYTVTPAILSYQEQLQNNIDKELIAKLININFDETESLNIIISGLVNQNQCCLFKLISKGIAATKILNWQDPVIYPSKGIIRFLENIGIDKNTLQIVIERGISAEAQEMIHDLGYYEQVTKETELACNCNLEIIEEIEKPYTVSNDKLKNTNSKYAENLTELQKLKVLERKNYLRQNLMVPLTWALNKTLKCNPTNPIHYIASQLLRWKYNNVDPNEMNEIMEFVIDATSKKDQNLLVKNQQKQEAKRIIKPQDKPCQQCLEDMQLHRIKKCSWKNVKKLTPKRLPCQFSEFCSDCKLDELEISSTALDA